MILSVLKQKSIRVVQLFLVVLFIVFEELIWEGIAKPIYTYIHGLRILQQIELHISKVNPTGILFIFVFLFTSVEALGVYAGLLFMSGNLVIGVFLYMLKIPIAALTFWLFRISENKLMQFGWFAWSYMKLMSAIIWIKSTEIYLSTMRMIQVGKEEIRKRFLLIKQNYMGEESRFIERLKHLYKVVKASLKKN